MLCDTRVIYAKRVKVIPVRPGQYAYTPPGAGPQNMTPGPGNMAYTQNTPGPGNMPHMQNVPGPGNVPHMKNEPVIKETAVLQNLPDPQNTRDDADTNNNKR